MISPKYGSELGVFEDPSGASAPISAVAYRLEKVLGTTIVAVIARTTEARDVDRLISGELIASKETAMALRLADATVARLTGRMHDDTMRAWFGGLNEYLLGSPAIVIRERSQDPVAWTDVLAAASAFLASS